MLDVTTTITVNGEQGARFLASLARYYAPVPRALRWLAEHGFPWVRVDRFDADLIADFVSEVLASGWIDLDEPPLFFSPRVGDEVRVVTDVLAEIGRATPGLPPMWRYLPAGTTGKLLCWRGERRAVIDVHGEERRLVVFLGVDALVRTHQPGRAYRRAG